MKLFRKISWLAVAICCFTYSATGVLAKESAALSAIEKEYPLLIPSPVQTKTSGDILNHLKHRHYLKINIDDRLSSKVLYRFLDELDPSHIYFHGSDIKEFEIEFRFKLDDALKKNDLVPGFKIFNRYQQRVIERLTYVINRLEQGLQDMNFSIQEELRVDRKDIPWPKTDIEMKELWRMHLKSSVLSLKLADKSLDEIQEILLRRYRNQLKRVAQNSSDDAFQFYMNALALSFGPHTQYFSPRRSENFNINMSLSLEGIGAVLQTEDEYTKVLRLIPAGPAERSKLLKAADRIVGVGQGADGTIIDVVGWRLDEVVDKIRGPKGTLVRLQIIPVDAEDDHQTKVISIVRDKVKLEEQAAQKKIIEVERDTQKYKFGVLDIPTFYADFKGMHAGNPDYKSTTRDVHRLLNELKAEKVDGIIIDLRDNGGGSLQEANSLTGLFIGLGPTVQVRSASGRIEIIRDHNPELVYDGPLVVLVNRMSASASEIFAGAIQDYRRGLILGEQTFGKGTVQSLLPLSQGQLKSTTAKYYRISGQSTQNRGIIPDLPYPSLYLSDQLGESSLSGALPWDKINSIPYQTYYQLADLIPWLQDSHTARNRMSMDYQYLLDRRQRNEELSKRKTVSLSEQIRKKERDAAEQWRLDLENTLRASKGLPPLEKIADLNKEDSAVPHGNAENGDDPLMDEAGEVMVDFIELLSKNVAKK
ncbi:MAG: carboxy terminal-processing peptidase [Proteobacteria bacterium]|nr:carboxy terminal-processing peptidase [Pseudomonadota bacterium]